MQFFRQYIAPVLVVLLFAFALLVVSARIFLPDDMAAPAPVGGMEQLSGGDDAAVVPDDATVAAQASSLDPVVHRMLMNPATPPSF